MFPNTRSNEARRPSLFWSLCILHSLQHRTEEGATSPPLYDAKQLLVIPMLSKGGARITRTAKVVAWRVNKAVPQVPFTHSSCDSTGSVCHVSSDFKIKYVNCL